MNPNYITPTTRIHTTFADAKAFFAERSVLSWYEQEEPLDLAVLAEGKRNLIVGEPGVGKSLLLEAIKERLDAAGIATALVVLRNRDAIASTHEFLGDSSVARKAVLLDALDEVAASDIPATIQKIELLARSYPDVAIFLSSRWVFIARHANQFPARAGCLRNRSPTMDRGGGCI